MIEKLTFGRTGHQSTRTIFGAAALGQVSQAEADRTLELLLKYGVNHIDTAASYGDSEIRIGKWMGSHRQDFFLASKTGDRTYQQAKESIARSLDRLKTDHLDLIQLHNLADTIEWQVALGAGGALEACLEAKQQGLVHFIGVTGHGLSIAAMHKRSLSRFDFDSILLPYNYVIMQDSKYAPDFEEVTKICQERNIAIQTIKSLARKLWDDTPHTHNTWYQPLEEQADIDIAVRWTLQRPRVFLNTSGDVNLLPKILEAAEKAQAIVGDIATTNRQMQELAANAAMQPLFV
jgi:aryl-alcohol dehydrogenase-like predicted oxidoreductase